MPVWKSLLGGIIGGAGGWLMMVKFDLWETAQVSPAIGWGMAGFFALAGLYFGPKIAFGVLDID